MDTLIQLKTFLAVARTGGFSEAARELNVVPSVVGKRITQLEHTLRERLFDRTTRQVSPTAAGRRLERRAAALVSDFDALLRPTHERTDDAGVAGTLRVAAPTTLATLRLAPVFAAFAREHPRVRLELVLSDRSINPAESDLDLAISGRTAHYDGVVDVPLAPVVPRLCASPAYLARAGAPAHPRDLAAHDTLVFAPAGRTWTFVTSRAPVHVEVQPRFVADDNVTLLAAARAGLGITVLPAYVVDTALDDGTLVALLPAFALQDAWFKAHVPARRHRHPAVQALLQVVERALALPAPGASQRGRGPKA